MTRAGHRHVSAIRTLLSHAQHMLFAMAAISTALRVSLPSHWMPSAYDRAGDRV